MKKILIFLNCLVFINLGMSTEVKAEELDSFLSEDEIIYSMDQGGLQMFEVVNDLGESSIITVQEEPSFSIFSISANSIKNGTYTITKERPLLWKASYKIDVKNKKITRAHSSSTIAYSGSFKSAVLKIDNSSQATYYLKHSLLLSSSSINLRAKLSGNNISVTY